jgi:hypothetical protein
MSAGSFAGSAARTALRYPTGGSDEPRWRWSGALGWKVWQLEKLRGVRKVFYGAVREGPGAGGGTRSAGAVDAL